MSSVRYNRILLKMGGEALAGPNGYGIDPTRATEVAQVVKEIYDLGVQVAIVIGGGPLVNAGKISLNLIVVVV